MARAHGDEQARLSSFGLVEIVLEYQILEEPIAKATARAKVTLSASKWHMTRRSIDLAMLDSLSEFTSAQALLRDHLGAPLAHYMRNPLSGMSLRAQLLLSPEMPKKGRDLACKIIDNGARLTAMFDELLDALAYRGPSDCRCA